MFSNNKPWVTKDLKALLNQKKAAFRSDDISSMKSINQTITEVIETSKKSTNKE